MPKDQRDPQTDTAQIEAVLRADITSFLARDMTTWEDQWVKDDRFQSIMDVGAVHISRGFEEFRANVMAAVKAAPDPEPATLNFENLTIHVAGDLAWATFAEAISDWKSPLDAPAYSHNMRLLERGRDGRWRILFHGCWSEQMRDTDTPAIELDPACSILWMNQAAARELPTHQGLSNSNGTLRAARPSWDKDLRATVERAHQLRGFGTFNKAAAKNGGKVVFPVVLGDSDDTGLMICWVRVADNRVYVLFDTPAHLDVPIEIAQVIYGLSAGQTEIVRLIAQGRDTQAAAQELGITKNTARTHLRRAYDKMGVGSQLELLRLLISLDQ